MRSKSLESDQAIAANTSVSQQTKTLQMLSVTLSSLSGTSLKLGSVVFPSPRVNIWFYYQPCCRTVFRIGSHTGWWGPKLVHNTVKETRSYRGTGSYIKIRGKFVFLFSCVDHNTEETSQLSVLFCFFFLAVSKNFNIKLWESFHWPAIADFEMLRFRECS